MAQKNIIVNLSNSDPDYISSTIRYARIDNTNAPVYTTLNNVTANPFVISNVPNGQYRIYAKPNFSDGRICPEQVIETEACTGITSLSAIYNGTNIIVTYTADAGIDNVKINVLYPNGGFSSQIETTGASPVTITPPVDVYGTFQVTIQAVCDEATGWFSVASAPVTFEIQGNTVIIQVVDPLGGASNRITNITGINGFTLPATVNEGETQYGSHTAFTAPITVYFISPIGSPNNNMALYINDVLEECLDASTGSGFTQNVSFASVTYAANDVIKIVFDYNICSP